MEEEIVRLKKDLWLLEAHNQRLMEILRIAYDASMTSNGIVHAEHYCKNKEDTFKMELGKLKEAVDLKVEEIE